MIKKYFISDTHFNHKNIIKYTNRSDIFNENDVETMNKTMINRWNEIVKNNDIVYFLGDFGLGGESMFQQFLPQLNGKIRIILGNHDPKKDQEWYLDLGFDRVYDHPIIIEGFYILSHRPIPYMTDKMPYVNIHGHTHNESYDNPQRFNVSWEILDGYPIDFEDIKKHFVEIDQVKTDQIKMWKTKEKMGKNFNDGYVAGYMDAKKEKKMNNEHKPLRVRHICNMLDKWADSTEDFKYVEYYDENNKLRMEFKNNWISFIYFVDSDIVDNFWFGARHHMPIVLVSGIIDFFKTFKIETPDPEFKPEVTEDGKSELPVNTEGTQE